MTDKKSTPSSTTPAGTPSVLPRPDFRFPGEVGRTYLDSDPAQFPQPTQSPKGAAVNRQAPPDAESRR